MPAPDLGPVLTAATEYGDQREAAVRAELQPQIDAANAATAAAQAAFGEHMATAHPVVEPPKPAKPAPIDGVIWWTHQSNSIADIAAQTKRLAGHKANVPALGGVSIRIPWNTVDTDAKLTQALEATKALAASVGAPMAFRLMAGRHTPAAVLAKSVVYRDAGVSADVPRPWDNPGFEDEYRRVHTFIAAWMTDNLPADQIKLLHYTWYGRDWAEINAGKEVRGVTGYSATKAAEGHARLMTIAHDIQDEYPTVAVEFPGSGYGDVFDITIALAKHAAELWGTRTDSFYMQANGWSTSQRWGQPDDAREKRLDPALAAVGSFGLQAIQPWGTGTYPAYTATQWRTALAKAAGARYLEIYDPSFDAVAGKELATYGEQYS